MDELNDFGFSSVSLDEYEAEQKITVDREKEVDITTDLEAIPQEEIAQEPSIFIDDEEMMPEDITTFSDDGTLTREDQISAEPSGTFVGQKIPPLREDFDSVTEAFIIHRDSYEEIKKVFKKAAKDSLNGVLSYTEEAVVSQDFVGSPYTSNFDANAGIELSPTFYKIISWYDNEYGYSTKLVELMAEIHNKS